MSESSREIEAHIRTARQDLSANISELEQRVKSTVDLRRQFSAHPTPFLMAAFGAGLLLASRVMRRSRRDSR
jgi:hypothetical protein